MSEQTNETARGFIETYGEAVCMAFDDHGNAFDCFDYTPEVLEQKARELREQMVTMEPSPFGRLAHG